MDNQPKQPQEQTPTAQEVEAMLTQFPAFIIPSNPKPKSIRAEQAQEDKRNGWKIVSRPPV